MFNWFKERKEERIREEIEIALAQKKEREITSRFVGIMTEARQALADPTREEVLTFIESAVKEKVDFFSQQPPGRQKRLQWANKLESEHV